LVEQFHSIIYVNFLEHDLLDLIEHTLSLRGAVELGLTRNPARIRQGGAVSQYSLASMMVSTRVVLLGSAGSSEPNSIAES
jgi:hypothetical protein